MFRNKKISFLQKFRRRHHEDRQDFESALLVRSMALTIGIIQKNANVEITNLNNENPMWVLLTSLLVVTTINVTEGTLH